MREALKMSAVCLCHYVQSPCSCILLLLLGAEAQLTTTASYPSPHYNIWRERPASVVMYDKDIFFPQGWGGVGEDYPPRLESEGHSLSRRMVPWLAGLPGELDRDHSLLVLLLCYTVPSNANTLPPNPPVGILFVTTELFITLKRNQRLPKCPTTGDSPAQVCLLHGRKCRH